MLIAQLSDSHVTLPEEDFAKLYDPVTKLREAARHVNNSVNRPDLVFLTGDLVNTARAEEYEILREILPEFEMPVYLLPGNHDDCTLLRKMFPDHDYLQKDGKLYYVVEGWPLKFICLDTNIHGKPQGHLGQEQLDWLEEELSRESDRPVVIFMHHPPFKTGLTSMDAMGLLDMAEFAEVISRHDHIERVLCGHLHRAIQRLVGGTIVQTCPSTSHQVRLLLGENNELSTTFEPPEYLLHYWTEKDGLVTHNDYVQDFEVAWTLEGELY
ncbi:phosphodiesterase [Sneathiella sp. CAU 1612]|uniref:Phosphodiesterase n=1 Tax=Sneathiella sedimenti TaxID=2816034 RepID=A0ABS3F7Q0_9PROT|nr:phosphodiesterase [Sneathiella sedimenti]MBO0334548.1 phosphodiesterase [Sneathiella sedimenti]